MKKLLTFLMMSIFAIGVGWAGTIVFANLGLVNGVQYLDPFDGGDFTVTFAGGSNDGKYYDTGSGIRVYGNGTMTVAAKSGTITEIIVTYDGANKPTSGDVVNVGTYTVSTGVWTGSASSVVFTRPSGNGHWRVKSVSATVVASNVATPTITLDPANGPYYEGSTVTATISCSTSGASLYYSYDNSSWYNYTQPLAITETTTIYAKAIKNGAEAFNIKTINFTKKVANIAAYSELDVDAEFVFSGDVVVTYINSTDTRYVWVKDNTGSALLFFSSGISSVKQEDIIKGGWSGKKSIYNGLYEIINVSEVNVEGSQTVTPAELTLGDVTVANQAIYGYLRGVTITAKNNRNFTISDGNTTVAGYNTYNNDNTINVPEANDGKTYNIMGIVNVFNTTAQFTPVSFTEVQVTGPKYYLVGDFNDWTRGDADYEFVKINGIYVLNDVDFPDNTEFKIVKVENNQTTDYGGNGGGAHYGIHSGHHENITIGGNDNFYIEPGAITNFSFTLNNNAPNLLTVTREAQMFVKGNFSNWEKVSMTGGSTDGWTLEQEISTNQQFGFVDEWGQWRGCGNNQNMITIEESNLGASLALWTDGKNFNMGVDGNFILNVAANKNNLIITRKAETSTAMFNFNDDYAALFPNLDLTTLPYEINEPITATVDGISVTISPKESSGTTTNKIWNNNNKLRVYSGTITITAPEGYNLTGIDFTNHTSNFNLTPSEGEMGGSGGDRTWTGETATLVLTATGNTQIGTMNVTVTKANSNAPVAPVIEGDSPFVGSTQVTITCATNGASVYYTTDGNDPTSSSTLYQGPFTISESVTVKAIAYSEGGVPSTITTKEFVKTPSVATIAQYKQLAAGTTFVFTGNVAVTYVNGKYLYVKDETGSALIFGNSNFDFTQGQVLETGWKAETTVYNGLLEAKNPEDVSATDQTVEITPEEKAVNAISTANDNEYIIVTNVSIDEPVNKNFTITDANGNTIVGRTNFNDVDHPTDFQAKYDITCLVGEYNGTVQLYPTEYNAAAVIEPVVLDGVAFTAARQWATWYGDASLALPEDVTAYVVTGVQGDAVAVEALDYIPAGTGVLLYSETAAESVSAMPYTGEAGTIPTTLLVGSLEAQTVSNAYLLYNNQFILAQDGTTVGAHRCYLPMSASAQGVPVLKIGTPGTVTGIETISTNGNGDNTYYNLMGQPVANPTPGIYIRGGKKVIVK